VSLLELTGDGMLIGLISVSIASVSSLVRNAVLDKEKLKSHRAKIKEHQSALKEATKAGDTKRAQKIQSDLLAETMENMKHGFKPMMYTFLPYIIIFGWLRKTYGGVEGVATVAGFSLGWFGWYLICSILASTILNKALKIY